jgi:hypothetical protein
MVTYQHDVHVRDTILLARDEIPDKNHTMTVTLQGWRIHARTFGLSVSIIDFTLSRVKTGAYIDFSSTYIVLLFNCSAVYVLYRTRNRARALHGE